jgi:hypothetical protein
MPVSSSNSATCRSNICRSRPPRLPASISQRRSCSAARSADGNAGPACSSFFSPGCNGNPRVCSPSSTSAHACCGTSCSQKSPTSRGVAFNRPSRSCKRPSSLVRFPRRWSLPSASRTPRNRRDNCGRLNASTPELRLSHGAPLRSVTLNVGPSAYAMSEPSQGTPAWCQAASRSMPCRASSSPSAAARRSPRHKPAQAAYIVSA